MKPLSALTAVDVASLRGVIFDLDGTLLTSGTLTPAAYQALHALADDGLTLVVCTGRPAAWGEVVQRQWPVALTLTENGAVAFRSDGQVVTRLDRLRGEARDRRRLAVLELSKRLRQAVPEVALADDNLGRLSDVTFDIGERARMPADKVAALRLNAARLGARTFESSIHLHVTLDSDDKASGTVRVLSSELGVDVSAARHQFAFIGDSINDEACFNAFRLTFGVDNIRGHLGRMSVGPRFVSRGSAGDGFAEIAARLLALRHTVSQAEDLLGRRAAAAP